MGDQYSLNLNTILTGGPININCSTTPPAGEEDELHATWNIKTNTKTLQCMFVKIFLDFFLFKIKVLLKLFCFFQTNKTSHKRRSIWLLLC